jgi:hypothetical protein
MSMSQAAVSAGDTRAVRIQDAKRRALRNIDMNLDSQRRHVHKGELVGLDDSLLGLLSDAFAPPELVDE